MTLLEVKVHGSTGTILLDRPKKRNALTRALLAELEQALSDLHQERRVRAVVLTGGGAAFCAGMDLIEMHETAMCPDSERIWEEDARAYRDLLLKMLEFPKPLIAAVGGPAVAGGAGLVLACDVVVSCAAASFGLPEPRRGLVAGIVAPLLAFRIGGGQAARLLLNPTLIDGEEAYRIGVYHHLLSEDLIWVRACEIADQCATGAPEAIQMTKRMLLETIGASLETELASGAAISATARTTEAAREGLTAFREKRDPVWK